MWDIASGKHRSLAVDGDVTALACSPDGKLLLGGGPDFGLRLWDLASSPQARIRSFASGPRTRTETRMCSTQTRTTWPP
ncbi:MAG: hypothetical protein AB7K24_34975 [Gemmataceae bacterium]